jgi:trimeric autotransporter adhesin
MNKALVEKETVIQTGFVAQEVEKAARELDYEFSGVEVARDAKDVYALKYSYFFVPLVKAVQELDEKTKEIDVLKEEYKESKWELAELRQMVLELKSGNNSGSSNVFKAYLKESTPNPAGGTALIRYYIPQNSGAAHIVFTDMKGAIIRSISVNNKSIGQLSVNVAAWTAGTYTYTLYVDGTPADSKKLVIAR